MHAACLESKSDQRPCSHLCLLIHGYCSQKTDRTLDRHMVKIKREKNCSDLVFFYFCCGADLDMQASSRQGPLPDLLPQNEQPSRASPHRRAARGGEAVQEMEVRRVANQLRAIGDEFNIVVLRRAVRVSDSTHVSAY